MGFMSECEYHFKFLKIKIYITTFVRESHSYHINSRLWGKGKCNDWTLTWLYSHRNFNMSEAAVLYEGVFTHTIVLPPLTIYDSGV